MSIVQLETAILNLPPDQFRELANWILALEQQRWDEELERDEAAGKLDKLAAEAIADFKAGHCRPL